MVFMVMTLGHVLARIILASIPFIRPLDAAACGTSVGCTCRTRRTANHKVTFRLTLKAEGWIQYMCHLIKVQPFNYIRWWHARQAAAERRGAMLTAKECRSVLVKMQEGGNKGGCEVWHADKQVT